MNFKDLKPVKVWNENKNAAFEDSKAASRAEREGFEPPVVLPTTVFKTAAFDRSAISPGAKVHLF
jgi:hypothetical protein